MKSTATPETGVYVVYQMIHFVLLGPYLSIGYIPMYGWFMLI
jgi:hypothetical protein